MSALWLGDCPERGCGAPAERLSTDTYAGPPEAGRAWVRCLHGHVSRLARPAPPLGRQMTCSVCSHEAHIFSCEWCLCDAPIPGGHVSP